MTKKISSSPRSSAPDQYSPSTSKDRRAAARATQRRRQRLRIFALVSAGVVVFAFVAFLIAQRSLNQPGQRLTDLGNTHITETQAASVTYNSKPPTSGPHFGNIASWGVHADPIPDAQQVHNLEDGGVGIWYDCPDGCPELTIQLEGIVNQMDEEGLLLAPYPGMDTRIALTAWTRLDPFQDFDEARIKAFIRAYRGIDHHRAGSS